MKRDASTIVVAEDHVALQGGGNMWVPLITVYEGLKMVSKNRKRSRKD